MKKRPLLFLISSLLWFFCAFGAVFTPRTAIAGNDVRLEYRYQSALKAAEDNGADPTTGFEAPIDGINTPVYPPASDPFRLPFNISGMFGTVVNGADMTFVLSEFTAYPTIFDIVQRVNIPPDLDIDITDIPDGAKINGRSDTVSVSPPERIPALMVRRLSEKIFHFPIEATRLRI